MQTCGDLYLSFRITFDADGEMFLVGVVAHCSNTPVISRSTDHHFFQCQS